MKKQLDYKVANGKLLRVEADLDNDIVHSIGITGDFFVHPESAITKIEDLLKGMRIIDVEKRLKSFITDNKIQIIGFDVLDIQTILERLSR